VEEEEGEEEGEGDGDIIIDEDTRNNKE